MGESSRTTKSSRFRLPPSFRRKKSATKEENVKSDVDSFLKKKPFSLGRFRSSSKDDIIPVVDSADVGNADVVSALLQAAAVDSPVCKRLLDKYKSVTEDYTDKETEDNAKSPEFKKLLMEQFAQTVEQLDSALAPLPDKPSTETEKPREEPVAEDKVQDASKGKKEENNKKVTVNEAKPEANVQASESTVVNSEDKGLFIRMIEQLDYALTPVPDVACGPSSTAKDNTDGKMETEAVVKTDVVKGSSPESMASIDDSKGKEADEDSATDATYDSDDSLTYSDDEEEPDNASIGDSELSLLGHTTLDFFIHPITTISAISDEIPLLCTGRADGMGW